MINVNSFTAADSIPVKLIKNHELLKSMVKNKVIPPIHVQFIPTNKCNLKCTFCSCSNEDRRIEMSFDDALRIIEKLHKLGTQSVTITGGGEPLLYPHLKELFKAFHEAGIKIGFVTNGLLLNRLSYEYVTWCRISNSDERKFNTKYFNNLVEAVEDNPNVDWAFSHVVSSKPNHAEIRRIVDFANLYQFTHVRLVADLLDYENVNLLEVKRTLRESNVDDDIVIYQSRNVPTIGGDCYICYLKPMIGADCKVYACCGIQYALKKPSKSLPKELCLGSAFDIEDIIKKSRKPFDGNICHRCYYDNYNKILGSILAKTQHMEFV